MEKKITLKQIAMVGVMAAAVYVASAFLQIPIPTAIDNRECAEEESSQKEPMYTFREVSTLLN